MTTIAETDLRRDLEDLKIAILSRGVRGDGQVLDSLGGAEALTAHEYSTTGGIPLRAAGLDMNAPFDEWYCVDADVELDREDNVLVLRHRGVTYEVECVYPLPGYVGELDAHGNRVDDIVFTHIERIRLSPITGCAYDCKFCDLPGRIRLRSVTQVLDAADRALADDALEVRHALISGGSPGPRDAEAFADTLVELVTALAPRLEVDVMMSSGSGTVELVERLVDTGVHGFSLNIEMESVEASQLYIRGKHRFARPFFDDTVRRAVELLGSTGRVRSLILPGLEPLESTLAGVEHIARLGADPVLSPFRPAISTALATQPPTSPGMLREVLDASRTIVAEHGVRLGPRCVPCQHNTLTFPWDVQ